MRFQWGISAVPCNQSDHDVLLDVSRQQTRIEEIISVETAHHPADPRPDVTLGDRHGRRATCSGRSSATTTPCWIGRAVGAFSSAPTALYRMHGPQTLAQPNAFAALVSAIALPEMVVPPAHSTIPSRARASTPPSMHRGLAAHR